MHVEHSGYQRSVKSTDLKKLILQPFRSVNIDAFSYSSHSNPMGTRCDRVCEKNFPIFHLWVAFLTEYFTCTVDGFLREPKLAQNAVFRTSILSTEGVGSSI